MTMSQSTIEIARAKLRARKFLAEEDYPNAPSWMSRSTLPTENAAPNVSNEASNAIEPSIPIASEGIERKLSEGKPHRTSTIYEKALAKSSSHNVVYSSPADVLNARNRILAIRTKLENQSRQIQTSPNRNSSKSPRKQYATSIARAGKVKEAEMEKEKAKEKEKEKRKDKELAGGRDLRSTTSSSSDKLNPTATSSALAIENVLTSVPLPLTVETSDQNEVVLRLSKEVGSLKKLCNTLHSEVQKTRKAFEAKDTIIEELRERNEYLCRLLASSSKTRASLTPPTNAMVATQPETATGSLHLTPLSSGRRPHQQQLLEPRASSWHEGESWERDSFSQSGGIVLIDEAGSADPLEHDVIPTFWSRKETEVQVKVKEEKVMGRASTSTTSPRHLAPSTQTDIHLHHSPASRSEKDTEFLQMSPRERFQRAYDAATGAKKQYMEDVARQKKILLRRSPPSGE
jgi:hypothetical protein